jgi:hypothetical protein
MNLAMFTLAAVTVTVAPLAPVMRMFLTTLRPEAGPARMEVGPAEEMVVGVPVVSPVQMTPGLLNCQGSSRVSVFVEFQCSVESPT